MPTIIVTFLLFFLPFVVIPIGSLIYEPPKVLIAEVLIVVLLLTKLLKGDNFEWIKHHQAKLYLGLFSLSLLGLLINPNKSLLFGNVFRLQGVFLLWLLLVFSLSASNIKLDKVNKWIYFLSLLFLAISALILGNNHAGRAIGTLGEPNALAATAIFVFFAGFFKHQRLVKIISLGLVLVILFLTKSQSGLLALLIPLTFIGLVRIKLSFQKGLIIASTLIIFSLTLPFVQSYFWQPTADNRFKLEDRQEIWVTAFSAGLKKPILGWGFGNVSLALKETSQSLNNNIQYQIVDSSHNFLLDYFVEGGIIGLGLILAIIYLGFKLFLQQKNLEKLILALGLIILMLFNPVSITVLIAFWWVFGQVV